ncbi:UvrD-helicase domain-containing protein [Cupriavidus consociatus]|uniref:UvrD-helicase domain-containing protein n=1 Tax=Cupriavidus consociatus TaxID=2821357 RepID=UPI001AE5F995|nr:MULTISPECIES: UvrD-helicase domain-containing protein [unclassified Cupriavidus]MBP0619341.1 UvrD-helicase domain-containing protein [Cupriavidus sp. LEh25]MDK2655989.1 UvrD-helicase domain-containing protein [Cupriavidus sp. LEh21]
MREPIAPSLSLISDTEIAWACAIMGLPDNAFSAEGRADPRLAVMRSLDTLDVEACPGSGKTTLLVAKLAILANRWTSSRNGICVLSHTNAARTEIGDRLSASSAGVRLLRHPHFIGTIHSFVNEFLAVPWLRSKGFPIKAIDTEIALQDRWRRIPRNIQLGLGKKYMGWWSMTYTRPDYTGGPKEEYSSATPTYKAMLDACRASTAAGYYCFDEMFIWASELHDRHPYVINTIRRRFPFVFIDEVQDNCELQAAFLHRLFVDGENPVIRQRFGDSNQAIYHASDASGAVTDRFPGPEKADLPNSFRFGNEVALVAAPLGVRPQALVGLGPTPAKVQHATCKNTLFLFDDTSVLDVLPAYARHLLKSFDHEALARGEFTAVAGVHRSDKDDHLPRFMGHYAPDYLPELAGRLPKPASFLQFLARARLELEETRSTHPMTRCCAEAMLKLIELSSPDHTIPPVRPAHRHLLTLLSSDVDRRSYLTILDTFIVQRGHVSADQWQDTIRPRLIALAAGVIGGAITKGAALQYLAWTEESTVPENVEVKRTVNQFQYPDKNPKVSIRLASIHGVKGETHTATLVLESFQKTHQLKALLPWLTGKKPKGKSDNTAETPTLQERLKLHYVAMTRPSHMLCLALRRDALGKGDLEAFQGRDWHIVDCSASEN